ncbi:MULTISPECIES: MFS transporter [Bradyrhizobium]|uniref:MFS transporter n=1 Tax=Bradyrhizobium TaxID=374 RepID=UPI001ED9C879|nr:MFS transporter [Bradyrhizobium zhengyangense]MCG2643696.1 MFS transporter [Bradyrhizobium zhengyangense]
MASVAAASGQQGFTPEEEKILSKVLWRIVPFLLLCYIVAYLDRVNVGIASLTMNGDLGISPSAFGWSAGLFFFGYFLAEVPSNLALQAIGARKWIARILITWGLISAATAFVVGPASFGVMRFLLGLGEAGFTPGVFLYFTYWFPARVRGTATAAFLLGIPIASIIGAPISSSLLTLDGLGGLHGWQWLLIIEGLPATLLGFACLFALTDKPEQASWLSPAERTWLAGVLASEREAIAARHSSRLKDAFLNWRVLVCAAVNFCAIIGSVGLGLWMPQIIKGFGFGVVAVGFIAAIPYICGAITMMLWARLSDNGGERSWFVASGLLVGAASLIVCGYATSSALVSIVALCGAVIGIMCYQSTFWPIPSSFLTGSAAAGGLAMIVSIGNLGGFVGPYLIGVIKQSTDSFSWALISVAAFLALAAILIRLVGASLQRQAGTADGRAGAIAPLSKGI